MFLNESLARVFFPDDDDNVYFFIKFLKWNSVI